MGGHLVSHLLSTGRYRVHFLPCETDYMKGRWRKEFKDLITYDPASLEIDESIDFCSVMNARRQHFARVTSTWFYHELNSIPKKVVEDINSNDSIYVCSSFVADVFEDQGVTVPMSILGHGFDPKLYAPARRKHGNEFVFLCVAEHTPRKNLPMLIESFQKAFQGIRDVKLILKLGLHGEGDIRRYITLPEQVVLHERRSLGEVSLARLYQRAHCFVLPTRAEGFGMPVLEAMATGLPVIVTRYSGHLDFCTDANSFLITNRGLVENSVDCFPHYKSEWGDPDPDHLISLMRFVHGNYDQALERGQQACRDAHSQWTWRKQLSRSFP